MTFKEELIKEVEEMTKVRNIIFFEDVFTKEEKQQFEEILKTHKEVISYLGD